jgi:hypothetical protein
MFWKTKKDKKIEQLESSLKYAETELSNVRQSIVDFLYRSPEYRETFLGPSNISHNYPEYSLDAHTSLLIRDAEEADRKAEIRRVIHEVEQENKKEKKRKRRKNERG